MAMVISPGIWDRIEDIQRRRKEKLMYESDIATANKDMLFLTETLPCICCDLTWDENHTIKTIQDACITKAYLPDREHSVFWNVMDSLFAILDRCMVTPQPKKEESMRKVSLVHRCNNTIHYY